LSNGSFNSSDVEINDNNSEDNYRGGGISRGGGSFDRNSGGEMQSCMVDEDTIMERSLKYSPP